MWHLTAKAKPDSGATDYHTKCIAGTCHPPRHVCLICEMEEKIERLRSGISALRCEVAESPIRRCDWLIERLAELEESS
jgi:hypothetical protein